MGPQACTKNQKEERTKGGILATCNNSVNQVQVAEIET